MNLGRSMRRRRGGKEGKSAASGSSSPGPFRFLPTAFLVSVLGLGVGFFLGTRVLFPAPERPSDLVEVPDLTGLTAGGVPSRLATVGLVLSRTDSVRHPQVPRGQVLAQSPLPGQLALPGDSVALVISAGPESRPVPDLVNLRGDRALVVLESSGFAVTVDSVRSSLPRGTVVALDPEPDSVVDLPARVHVSLSLGPPMVEVPLLVGLPQEEALVLLDSLGLVVEDVEERFRFGLDQGTVIQQIPAAGEEVEEGSGVRLVVGRRSGG